MTGSDESLWTVTDEQWVICKERVRCTQRAVTDDIEHDRLVGINGEFQQQMQEWYEQFSKHQVYWDDITEN